MKIALNKYSYILWGVVSFLPLFVSGCTEDIIGSQNSRGEISFNVENVTSIQNTTRSSDAGTSSIVELAGSSKPLFLVPSQTDGMPNLQTRGQAVTSSTISSFAIYASRTNESTSKVPDYMYNVEITRQSGWTPAQEYLWPGDSPLHFIGYSPYVAQPATVGITTLPSSGSPRSIDFTTPGEIKDQFDLLYCVPTDASSSPCDLTFNHALTAIKFVTGTELAPCEIKSITISGVLSEGTLDLEQGNWNDLKGNSTYTLTLNKSFVAARGSQYVEAGSPITDDEQLFLLIPQIPGTEAQINITADFEGRETTLTASLEGQVWNQGTTTTYRLSANPDADSLILDVSGDFTADYTGSEIPFTVKSFHGTGNNSQPVNWIAEFVDDKGEVISQPSWVKTITSKGSGNTSGTLTTQMNDMTFLSISDGSRILQQVSDINTSSGITPYNLSSASGSSIIENTANTYIINAPGTYSIPLVYGNGIKNSQTNSEAYIATTHNRYALKTFVNNFGNAITDPYIYNNAGCTPAEAFLVWEDQLNLVRNTRLSSDGKTILFDIPQNTIRQGNALVAVKDKDNNILWSWQLWITDYNTSASSGIQEIMGINVFTRNIGYVTSGDKVEFEACSVKIRFTQTDVPEGLEPLSKIVELTQSGITKATGEYNTFYEWGRKDPMWDSNVGVYTAEHKAVSILSTESPSTLSALSELPQWGISHPTVKMSSKENLALPYNNLWNVEVSSTDNIKSIYDPSPVGYKIALSSPFQDYAKVATVNVSGNNFLITSSADPATLILPALGYIEPGNSNHSGQGQRAEIWYATIMANRINAGCLVATPSEAQSQTNSPFSGFSVRPIAE